MENYLNIFTQYCLSLFDGLKNLPAILVDSSHGIEFSSGLFMLTFLGFLMIYQLIRRWNYPKLIFVILFSLYFYYKSSVINNPHYGLYYAFIPIGIAVMDYFLGLWMRKVSSKSAGRVIIGINVLINIGMLVYFKYFNMLGNAVSSIIGSSFQPLVIIYPIGLSFLVFRSISYLVDIYRGKLAATTNFIEYLAFLTFFPPMLAGPVVRAKDMLPQIKENPRVTRIMVSEGLFLIMLGLVKKVVIADYISLNFVDRIFENPSLYTGFENIMGCFGWVIQIYCDFSGYSDMAIGFALLMGYRFKENFNSPYKSQNPSEFWKRWHISLSSWLMDYLYIPLGGNRRGKWRQYLNLMITFLIGGLWHGADWIWMLWGGYSGALIVGHKAIKRHYRIPERWRGNRLVRFFNVTVTFILIMIGMVIIRADSVGKLLEMWQAITTNFHFDIIPQFVQGYTLVVIAIVVAFLFHFTPDWLYRKYLRAYNWLPFFFQAIILAIVVFIVIQTKNSDVAPFIYMKY